MKKDGIKFTKAKKTAWVLKQQPKHPGLERQVAGEKGQALKWVTCHYLPRWWSSVHNFCVHLGASRPWRKRWFKYFGSVVYAQELEFRFTEVSRTGWAKAPKKRHVQRARLTFHKTFPFKIPKLHTMRSQETRESGIHEVEILNRDFGRFVGLKKRTVGLRLTKEEAPSKHLRFQLGCLKACAPGIKEYPSKIFLKKNKTLVRWTGICLPMQETRVQSLGGGDSTCLGANKPKRYNYWSLHT